jgi:hypothetical protein
MDGARHVACWRRTGEDLVSPHRVRGALLPTALATVVCLGAATPALAQSVNTLWTARGIEGQRKIGALTGQKQLSEHDRCDLLVEGAYALHTLQEPPVKVGADGSSYFHFIVHAKAGELDFVFIYADGAVSARIDRMPKEWQILLLAPAMRQGKLGVGGDGCILMFDISDPLTVGAYPTKASSLTQPSHGVPGVTTR